MLALWSPLENPSNIGQKLSLHCMSCGWTRRDTISRQPLVKGPCGEETGASVSFISKETKDQRGHLISPDTVPKGRAWFKTMIFGIQV